MLVRARRIIFLASGVFSVLSCARDTAPTQPSDPEVPSLAVATAGGTWTTKAPMPTPRSSLTAGVQNNSLGQPILYAIGGFNAGWVRTVEAYNFATNTWTRRANLPLGLAHTNGVGVIGGKLYVSGGTWSSDGVVGGTPVSMSMIRHGISRPRRPTCPSGLPRVFQG